MYRWNFCGKEVKMDSGCLPAGTMERVGAFRGENFGVFIE